MRTTIAETISAIDRDHSCGSRTSSRPPMWPDQHPRTKRWNCACCGQPGRLYPRGPRCNDCLHPKVVAA